jgi:hypothetical protein
MQLHLTKNIPIAIILLLPNITSAAAPSPSVASTSYTSVTNEEKWVLEEEFHGASKGKQFPKREDRRVKSFPEHEIEDSWWDDDDSDDDGLMHLSAAGSDNVPHAARRKHRWRLWKNKKIRIEASSGDDLTKGAVSTSSSTTKSVLEEHPMRTDEWEFDVQLSRLFSKHEADLFPEFSSPDNKKRGRYRKRQVMQFARNGYVKVFQDEHKFTSNNMDASFVASPTGDQRKSEVKVGKWRIGHSGVAFDIPVISGNGGDDTRMTVLHYHADIHLNKFGERPRMFRGVITRDR